MFIVIGQRIAAYTRITYKVHGTRRKTENDRYMNAYTNKDIDIDTDTPKRRTKYN